MPPSLTQETVADAVAEQFALTGEYTELVSERDQNFRLTTADDKGFVVKVTSLAQEAVVTDFQIAVLLHLEDCDVEGVPRIVRTVSGDDSGVLLASDGREYCLRIVTWLHGSILDDCELTPGIARQMGQRLAELDVALQDFSHAGDSQELLWDSQRAGELRRMLVHVDDSSVRRHLELVLDEFDARVKPALKTLPNQVIHNDAHGENVLVGADGTVTGIIDFGDMLRAPRIVEVSTAAAYLRTRGDDPLQFILPLVAAYRNKSPLEEVELELLFDLIRTRLSMTIILFYWRLAARDENDPYRQKLLDGEDSAVDFLKRLSSLGRDAFRERIGRN